MSFLRVLLFPLELLAWAVTSGVVLMVVFLGVPMFLAAAIINAKKGR